MSRGATAWSLSVLAGLLAAAGAVFLLWPDGNVADDKARDFCWDVSARVSSDDVVPKKKRGSVSECAARLEKAAHKDRAELRTEVTAYGRHTVRDPDRMPTPVRRALARALAERPGLVQAGLADGRPRDSGATKPYLDRQALSATVRAVARDDAALRTLRTSQESYVRSRIATLTRADFDNGEDSDRAVTVVESVGRATATLTVLAQSARHDATRGERADYYGRHGYPRVRDLIEGRARAVGVPQADIQDSGSPMGDLKFAAERAYNDAAEGNVELP